MLDDFHKANCTRIPSLQYNSSSVQPVKVKKRLHFLNDSHVRLCVLAGSKVRMYDVVFGHPVLWNESGNSRLRME
jgi:hypothetical protein